MQLTCLRSKSILYTLLCDVRAGFCKEGFLASGFLLLCDKGGTTENYRAGGERRKEKGISSPLFVFLALIDNTVTVLFSQRCYFNGHYTGEFGNNKANSRVRRDVAVSIAFFGRVTDFRFTILKCLI